MKLSDYIADFLANQEIKYAFVITGGASVHLIDSIARHPNIDYICCLHEQACAMAADGYSRAGKMIGVAISTSGPGGTNLITGICSAFYDSIAVLYITGQVSTFRMKGATGVRQIGFQETDMVDICRPITKYAVLLTDPKRIRYELEKCWYEAHTGRPGPVLLDIPDNLQRADINPSLLESFNAPNTYQDQAPLESILEKCIALINSSERPVLIFGHGVHLAGARDECRKFVELCKVPFALTWAAADLFPSNLDGNVGTFGTHGTRYANFIVQNADLILSIGTRLDTKATGSPPATFAREAKKIMVDIDPCEINKFNGLELHIDIPVNGDAREFLICMNEKLKHLPIKRSSSWIERILQFKNDFPICPTEYYKERNPNPYVFVKTLSDNCRDNEHIVIDTGCTVAWMMQAFEFKHNQRMLHDWNNTAMGWALPAAIGACFALNRQRIICIMGDGSLYMNMQELITIIKHQLPIKIFVLNNKGYSMIQQTQEQWLESHYHASSVNGGLPAPDLCAIAGACGFETYGIHENVQIPQVVNIMFSSDSPMFCNVEIDSLYRVVPQVKFGRPNEDAEPLLSRDIFLKNMIVKPMDVSIS